MYFCFPIQTRLLIVIAIDRIHMHIREVFKCTILESARVTIRGELGQLASELPATKLKRIEVVEKALAVIKLTRT